jgi:dephospho-CoA kinase
MRVFGLTGGMASGKSTVARLIAARGIPVFDADQAARTVVEPGQPALADIIEKFGRGVLQADGTLDRAALATIVFRDDDQRKELEAITHPHIRQEIQRQIDAADKAGHRAVVVEAALLVESGWYKQMDGLIVVSCPREIQIQRILARDGVSMEQAEARLDAQLPGDARLPLADYVIDNSGLVGRLDAQIDELARELTAS